MQSSRVDQPKSVRTRQRNRFWQFRWRESTVVVLSMWCVVFTLGLGAIWFRSWQGNAACPAKAQSSYGESHWSYRDFGHYCTYSGQPPTKPSGAGLIWLAATAVGGVAVVASLASCVTPPRRRT